MPNSSPNLPPTGVLRAAINMGNFLLVTGKAPNGDPTGVSPDMALAIGAAAGVPVKFIPYARPGEIADDAEKGEMGHRQYRRRAAARRGHQLHRRLCRDRGDLSRAGRLADQIGHRGGPAGKNCAVTARSAYGLWLENNYKKGELVQFDNAGEALKAFDAGGFDAYAGLRPGLIDEQAETTGSRILDGQFTAVQQAVGTPRRTPPALNSSRPLSRKPRRTAWSQLYRAATARSAGCRSRRRRSVHARPSPPAGEGADGQLSSACHPPVVEAPLRARLNLAGSDDAGKLGGGVLHPRDEPPGHQHGDRRDPLPRPHQAPAAAARRARR